MGPQRRVTRSRDRGSEDEAPLLTARTEAGIDAGEPLAALLNALLSRRRFGGRQAEKRAALLKVLLAVAVGEQAEVANADETERQNVEKEAADELGGMDLFGAPLAIALVVLVAEEDLLAFHAEKALVGDRDPVSVTGEVLEDGLGTVEGSLGEDDPILVGELIEEVLEADGMTELAERISQHEKGLFVGVIEGTEKRLLEESREDTDLQEELGVGLDPVIAYDGRSGPGHDVVDMWMKDHPGSPSVQDAGTADLGTEMLGVGGQNAEGLLGGMEQGVVEPFLVGSGERVKCVRSRENGVEVGNGQQLPGPGLDPLLLVEGLALGAVPISAGIVEVDLAIAGIAAKQMPAERSGPTELDGSHDGPLLLGDGPIAPVGLTEVAEDIRDFELRAVHRRSQRASRSRGLVTPTLFGATLR